MYVPQLIYYGVSPPRKNASVFYGDKSSLKHFASIDLSANNRTTARNRFHVWMIPASFFLFSFLLFFLTVEKTSLLEPRIFSSRSISTIKVDRKKKGKKIDGLENLELGFNYFSP